METPARPKTTFSRRSAPPEGEEPVATSVASSCEEGLQTSNGDSISSRSGTGNVDVKKHSEAKQLGSDDLEITSAGAAKGRTSHIEIESQQPQGIILSPPNVQLPGLGNEASAVDPSKVNPKAQEPEPQHLFSPERREVGASVSLDESGDPDPLLKSVKSNGRAAIVPNNVLSDSIWAIHHDSRAQGCEQVIDVHREATATGESLPAAWTDDGMLREEHVVKKGMVAFSNIAEQDHALELSRIIGCDREAEQLHRARVPHEMEPCDMQDMLGADEEVLCHLRCLGFHGVPSTQREIVGNCSLVLTRAGRGAAEGYRRIYFFQGGHEEREFGAEGVSYRGQQRRECYSTRQTSTLLDMITVEDQLAHAYFEQIDRTAVKKRTRSTASSACELARRCTAVCPQCSVDLCQAAEAEHCAVPCACFFCCTCILPACCSMGHVDFAISASEKQDLLSTVVSHSALTTERLEAVHTQGGHSEGGGHSLSPPHAPPSLSERASVNRMDCTEVQMAALHVVGLSYAFPGRPGLQEAIAIVSPHEPSNKAMKFVMHAMQKPIYCPPPGTRFVQGRGAMERLRCAALGEEPSMLVRAATELRACVHKACCACWQ
mmetsp:Transcript_59972/g.123102  ORF Transcript_59972/g.123102 Transcript_59972/m.123102 type:complete len:604 (+) Transcript_59972:239-2050(+)|eukprot:CAMPEP_0181306502 /NCGR_PEP_ID=MMETSP1101-20121128/10338_1 /TAXON_ID=46948 /ORGANISM="Rhodomonas abbreviata, Strain Caron Lab Isolate" /LENGTH=603 /DNA_ID=CAMNT_0023412571 /DNA_START=228 /DNA_END=2039 /DNA_ORIENTATION=+